MAVEPAFATTPHNMYGLTPASADTSFTSPSNFTSLGSGATNGTKIAEIDIIPVGTTVAGVVNVFIYDGTNHHLLVSATIAAAAPSTTVAPVPLPPYTFENLNLKSTESLRVSTTVAGNASVVEVNVMAADY